MLLTTGITDSNHLLKVNLGCSAVSTVSSWLRASQIERMGRRPTIIWTTVRRSICFACITAGTGVFAETKSTPAASAGCRHHLYLRLRVLLQFWNDAPPGDLSGRSSSYETRRKGIDLTFSIAHDFTLLNQFCFPVALKNIGWHTYTVFIVWDLIEAAISFFVSVDTKSHALEEMSEIFESPNPAKASLRKTLD